MSGQGFGYPNQYPQPPQQGQPMNPQMYAQMYPNVNQMFPGNPSAPPAGYGFQPYPGQLQPSMHQPQVYPYSQAGQPGQHPAAMSYASVNVTPSYGQPPFIHPTPATEPTIEWVPTTPENAQMLSNRAVVAGYEGHDGSPLWVIRARFQDDIIPGKLAVAHKAAYVAWGGNENAVRSIEVCCARPEKIRWIESSGNNIPANAIIAGSTKDGEPLYVGRAKESGSLTPGKVHPSHKVLYISFSGKEIAHRSFEIMCSV